MTEGAVFGARSGRAAAAHARQTQKTKNDDEFSAVLNATRAKFGHEGSKAAARLKLELQSASWANIGPVRSEERLSVMDKLLDRLERELEDVAIPDYAEWNQAFIEYEELRNLLATARLVSAAARERDGSLGGHVRLDGGEISAFSQPYSTVVANTGEGWRVSRTVRPRTPFKAIVSYKVKEACRKAQIKWLRMLPSSLQDRKLEKKYQLIMGPLGAAEIAPGGVEAAIGEATKA